jgi:acetyl esterase
MARTRRPLRIALALSAVVVGQVLAVAPPARAFTLYSDLQYGPASGSANLLDIYVPDGASGPYPTVLVIHGGGWIDGDKTDWASEAERLTRSGFVAVAPNYRLAPTYLYPAALEDLQLAVEWIRSNAVAYSIDPANIGALGGSTGGHLAALLAMKGSGDHVSDGRIDAAVSWSGPMNLITYPNDVKRFLGCGYQDCPKTWRDASPYYNVDSTDPALFLANGTTESVPVDQPKSMARKLKKFGVPYELVLVDGPKHSRGYENIVWDATVSFLHSYLGTA